MLRISSFVIALLLPLSGYAHNHADEPATLPEKAMAFAQTAPVKFQPGKGVADLQSWGRAFGDVVESNGTPYRMTTWTPFYSNLAALPDIAQFDTLFFGVWPSIADFGKGWDGFFKNGAKVQAALDEIVVPSNQRSMAVLYSLSPSKGQYEPNNGLIRILGCELSEGKTVEDAYAAGVSAAHKADEGGLGFNASFMMVPGPGAAPSQENHVYLVEAFRSITDYGVGYDKMTRVTRRAIRQTTGDVMSCDAPRLYLSNAVYWPVSD